MIAEGATVVVMFHDEKSIWKNNNSNHILKVSGTQKLFKKQVDVSNLVGAPYGSIFEVVGNKVERIYDQTELFRDEDLAEWDENEATNTKIAAAAGSEEEGRDSSTSTSKGKRKKDSSQGQEGNSSNKGDNRNYHDTNTSQKMSSTDIEQMRQSGASGTEIIQQLVKNSDTWDIKNDFAQNKWLQKKKKKYLQRFRVIESTPLALCEVYNNKSRDKICVMRPDSLAHILSHSGVYSGGRVLIFESMLGLITGSVAQRMGGDGRIISLYEGQQPRAEIIDFLNLDEETVSIIVPSSTVELGPAAKDVREKGFYSSKKRKIDELDPSEAVVPEPKEVHAPPKKVTRPHLRTGRQKADSIRIQQWLREGFRSLIIASKYDPLPILQQAVVLMAPSSPIVIYSEYAEPLNECFLFLQRNNLAVKLSIAENWLRSFQTLPGRVRPLNFMSSTGGFVLTGVVAGGGGE